MTHRQLIETITPEELTQWNIFHNSEKWQGKLNNTPEGRSQRILSLITTGK